MDTNELLYDSDNSYKLTNIKAITVQPKNGGGSVRLDGEDLYIQKCGSYYVLFQKSSNKDSIMHLEEVKRLTNVSSGVIITFIYTSKYARIERFYSAYIKLDFVIDIKYDLDYYITGIFIPFSYTNFDLRNYVSNLYMMYSGNNINIRSDYYGTFPVPQSYTLAELRDANTKALINIDRCECMYDYITDDEDIIIPGIEKVIFNDPATIVFWTDGTKTVVKTQNNETYNKEMGLAMAISKKVLGNTSKYYDTFKKWIK